MEGIKKYLAQIGIDGAEASVYIATLQTSGESVRRIADLSGIKRTSCYHSLEKLVSLGLVKQASSGKRRVFIAEPPEQLRKIEEERRSAIERALPILKTMYGSRDTKPRIELYEGLSGVWRVYEDALNHPDTEVLSFIPTDFEAHTVGRRRINEYVRKRIAKNIFVRAIFPKMDKETKELWLRQDKQSARESRFFNDKSSLFDIGIDIYGNDKVALTSPREGVGIIIRSSSIHNSFKTIFEMVWKSLQ